MHERRQINIDMASAQAKPAKPPLTPQEIAQRQAARLGVNAVAYTLFLPAGLFTLVALYFNVRLAAELSSNWGDAIGMILVAAGATLALAGAPIGAALLGRSHPRDASRLMSFWAVAALISGTGALFTVTQTNTAPALTAEVAQRATELRAQLRHVSQAEFEVWNRSGNCRTPQDAGDQAVCDAIAARDAQARAELASIERGSGYGVLRRLGILLLSFAALGGAGLLGRSAVLASAESYRLATGDVGLAPVAPPAASPPQIEAHSGMYDAQSAFSMWANHRLHPVLGARVSGNDAYEDYKAVCEMNGIEPLAAGKFGGLLTRLADASEGRILKTKIGGIIYYQGWQLANQVRPIGNAPLQRIAGPS